MRVCAAHGILDEILSSRISISIKKTQPPAGIVPVAAFRIEGIGAYRVLRSGFLLQRFKCLAGIHVGQLFLGDLDGEQAVGVAADDGVAAVVLLQRH